jgi:argininosuccinate lyase
MVVERGFSFRTAHHIMGRLVRLCAERGLGYQHVDPDLVDEAARDITGKPAGLSKAFIEKALDPRQFVAARDGYGGTAPKRVRQMIASRTKALAAREKEVAALLAELEKQDAKLLQAVNRIAA